MTPMSAFLSVLQLCDNVSLHSVPSQAAEANTTPCCCGGGSGCRTTSMELARRPWRRSRLYHLLRCRSRLRFHHPLSNRRQQGWRLLHHHRPLELTRRLLRLRHFLCSWRLCLWGISRLSLSDQLRCSSHHAKHHCLSTY